MPLAAGTRLGPYEIVAQTGAGGMGEVYRALDVRLNRTVALKVLPPELSADPERRKRLEREAQAISSLSHPHICALYDVGNEAGTDFLVMEYLEGETLQARLHRGPLPLDQVLRYGSEIADALDSAHRKGVTHRDLKPGNVMLTKSGAKLLDFGLARFVNPVSGAGTPADLTTQSVRLTQEGAVLGTWQYMAPEQVEAKDTDARTDIFALGTVLYEMATGQPAFIAKSNASLIAAILSSEPPAVSSLQKTSPAALDRVIKRCLEKDPEERWQSAKDLASELKWIAAGKSQAEIAPAALQKRKLRERLILALAVLATAAALALAFIHWAEKPVPAPTVRLSLLPPKKTSFSGLVVLSPDGHRLAFTVDGPKEQRGLWVRALDSETAQLLPGTEDASGPFWSPDSRYIGFFTEDKLKRVEASGGAPEILCNVPREDNRTGAWSGEGVVLFSVQVFQPIRQINLSDCSIKPVTRLDDSRKEIGNTDSHFLPDGRHFLWVSDRLLPDKGLDIYASSLDSEERRLLIHNASMPSYVAPGTLVFVRGGKLMAQAFNAKQLRATGEPAPLVPERVAWEQFGGRAAYSVSATGVLVYLPDIPVPSQFQWRDRSGKLLGNLAESGFNRLLQLSPDARRVLVGRSAPETQTEDIWIYDLTHAGWTRFTFNPLPAVEAIWSPDGRQIVYFSRREGAFSLYRQALDGSGTPETLLQSSIWFAPRALSPDGRYLLCENNTAQTGYDLWLLPLSGERKPTPFIQTPFNEGSTSFAPNGRWVSYVSDKSGKFEIYVRPFPGPGDESRISSGVAAWVGGGSSRAVIWRGDGKELFYLAADWKVMSVPLGLDGKFQAGTPRALFALPPYSQFDVTADGQRFLVNAPVAETEPVPLNVVLNWAPEHERK